MSQLHCKSVVVGVDGSKAAIGAAMWAIDEAISRELPLRLVHVVPREPVRSSQPSDWEVECGEMALRQAAGAVHGMGKAVEVETALLSGDLGQILIDESQDAALVCLGVGKRERGSDELLGPTAAALAARAHCPVAIIRSDSGEPPAQRGVIAVVLNDEP